MFPEYIKVILQKTPEGPMRLAIIEKGGFQGKVYVRSDVDAKSTIPDKRQYQWVVQVSEALGLGPIFWQNDDDPRPILLRIEQCLDAVSAQRKKLDKMRAFESEVRGVLGASPDSDLMEAIDRITDEKLAQRLAEMSRGLGYREPPSPALPSTKEEYSDPEDEG